MSDQFTPILSLAFFFGGIMVLFINGIIGIAPIIVSAIIFFLPEYWWWHNHANERIVHIKEKLDADEIHPEVRE
jgi:hypothetical protein